MKTNFKDIERKLMRTTMCSLILVLSLAAGSHGAEVRIDPDTTFASYVNDTVAFSITVSNVDSLYAFACDLSFDPELIQIVEILEGELLCCSGGDSVSVALTYSIEQNNVIVGLTQLDTTSAGASAVDAASLVTIRAKIMNFGSSNLILSNLGLMKPDGVTEIPCTTYDGQVVSEYPAWNIVVDFNPADTAVYNTQSFSVQLTVDNVEKLFGFSADIGYPQEIIRVDSVTEGPLLSVYGSKETFFDYQVDSAAGLVLLGGAILSYQDTGVTTYDPVPLAYLFLTAISVDSSSLNIYNISLLAPNGIATYPIDSIGRCDANVLPTSEIVFQPEFGEGKDASIYESTPDQNYGDDSVLAISSAISWAFSLLEFPVNGITSEAIVGSAVLSLYGGMDGSQDTVAARAILDSWDESAVTWNTMPDTGEIIGEGHSDTVSWWDFEVTSVVQDWVEGAANNYGFQLMPKTFFGDSLTFYSSDYVTDHSYTPKLVVNYYYPPTCPDLVVSRGSIEFSEDIIVEDDTVEISARIYNTGISPVTDVLVEFYNGMPGVGQYELIDDKVIPYVGGHDYQITSVDWSTSGESGERTIFVWVDPYNAIAECDTINNKAAVNIAVMHKADLFSNCDNFDYFPAFPTEGETLNVGVNIINDGEAPAHDFAVNLYLGDPNSGGTLLSSFAYQDTIYGGTADSVYFQWNTSGHAGPADLYTVLDYYDAIAESDEANNTFHCQVNIYNPNLEAFTYCPTDANPNDTILYEMKILNLGFVEARQIELTIDFPPELLIDTTSIPPDSGFESMWSFDSLAANDSLKLDIELTVIPTAQSGSVVDIDATIDYYNLMLRPQPQENYSSSIQIGEDVVPPQFLVTVNPEVTKNDTVTVFVTPSESLSIGPIATAIISSSDTLPVLGPEIAEDVFRFKIPISDTLPHGTVELAISGNDVSGNQGNVARYFSIDHLPPDVEINVADTLPLGQHTLSLSFTENLQAVPSLELKDAADKNLYVELLSHSGINYNYSVTVADSNEGGVAVLSLQYSDIVGNDSTVLDGLYILNDAPEILVEIPSILPKGNTQFTVHVSKQLASFPELNFYASNSIAIEVSGPTCLDTSYVYTARITAVTAEGQAELHTRVTDLFGNSRDTTLYVTVDRTKPAFSIQPDDETVTGDYTLTMTSSERLAGIPVISVFLGDGVSESSVTYDSSMADSLYYFSGSEDDTVTYIEVEGVDLAGNIGSDYQSYLDISVRMDQIQFSAVPGTGSDVTISTYIHNSGHANADSVKVGVWRGFPGYGLELDSGIYIDLPANDSVEIDVEWQAHEQLSSYVVYIVADPDDRFIEPDEANNVVWKGSFVLFTFSNKRDFVTGIDTSAIFYSRAINMNNGQLLTDSSITITFDLKDTLGNVIIENDTLSYDAEISSFTKVINPSSLLPNLYRAYFHGDVGGGVAVVHDSLDIYVHDEILVSSTVNHERFYRGDTILISGTVMHVDSTPIVDEGVNILIKSKGGTRLLTALTGAYGAFSAEFHPYPYEAGYYDLISFIELGGHLFSDSTSFEIQGAYIGPSSFNLTMSQNSEHSVTFTMSNIGISPIALDSITLTGPPYSITGIEASVDTSNTNFDVPGGSATTFAIQISASSWAEEYASYGISVAFEDSLAETCSLYVHTQPARPIIVASQSNIEFYMNPGQSRTKEVTLTNSGYTAWRDLSGQGETPSWLHVSFPSNVESLGVGSSLTFDISVAIPDPFDYGVYDTTFAVYSSNHNAVTLYFRMFVTSSTTGDARFVVMNQQGDSLAGAEIYLYSQVYDPYTNSYPVYHGYTNSAGVCDFMGIPSNAYKYKVSANNHQSESGSMSLLPGQSVETETYVILEPEVITFNWEVGDTTVTGEYNVTLNITVDTSLGDIVPPLLYFSPHVLAHSASTGGITIDGSFILSNQGEMIADDVQIHWPDNQYFSASLNGDLPDALNDGLHPGESVPINYRITIGGNVEPGGKYDDWISATCSYSHMGYEGSLEFRAQYYIRCDDLLRFDPPCIVNLVVPCWADNSCDCDIAGLFVHVDTIRATNIGYETAEMLYLFSLELSLSLSIFSSASEIAGALAQSAQTVYEFIGNAWSMIGLGPWSPKVIDPGQTSIGSLHKLTLPDFGLSVGGGSAVVISHWETSGHKVHFVPILRVVINDLGIGEFLSCIIIDSDQDFIHSSSGPGDGDSIGPPPDPPPDPPPPIPGPPDVDSTEGGLVSLQIDQNLTLEQQAFTANMEIINNYEAYTIDAIDIDISVKDANGYVLATDQYATSGPLFFSSPELTGMSDIDGGGVVATHSVGNAHWLVIPKTDAGGSDENGTTYYLQANISYSIGGVPYSYSSQEPGITVLPQPKLEITYFLPEYIRANYPFKLAALIHNVGYGPAHDLQIDSDQPVILEGAEFMDRFEIIGSYVMGEEQSPSFLIEFGDLPPGQKTIGYWIIEAEPGGQITDFTASYAHTDALGGSSTSLISEVSAETIYRDNITIGSSGGVGFFKLRERYGDDFVGLLVDASGDANPDMIYNLFNAHSMLVNTVFPDSVITPTYQNPVLKIYTQPDTNWIFLKLSDPFGGTKPVSTIIRQDGSELDTNNFWFDSSYIHFCDIPANNISYSVTFGDLAYKPDLFVCPDSINMMACSGCGSIDAGDSSVIVSYAIENVGNLKAHSIPLICYNGETDSGIIIDSIDIDSLGVGELYRRSFTWNTAPPPDWKLFYRPISVFANPDSQINESDYGNNLAFGGVDFGLSIGDCNHNGSINIADVVYLINYLFRTGPEPRPTIAGDVNCSEEINIGDIVYMLNYIFGGHNLCDPRLPGQKLAPQRSAEVYLASAPANDRELTLLLSGTFECAIAGIQFELGFAGSNLCVTGVSSGNATETIPYYYSHSDSSLIVGFVDIHERKLISKNGGELLKIKLTAIDAKKPSIDEIEVKNIVLVDEHGTELHVDLKTNWANANIPKTFFLAQNYPNPFNPTTVIEFGLPKACQVKLKIINILGQTVKTLIDQQRDAGYVRLMWDGTNSDNKPVASGVYFYRLQAGEYTDIKKMVILK